MTPACTDRGGRGCPCAYHAQRRVYARNYVRRRYAKALNAKRMSARVCPRRFGRAGVCGAVLQSDVIGGRIVVTCPACERFARGICRDCPRPVDGTPHKARRCAEHRKAANRTSLARYAENNRDEVNRRARASYRDEAVRRRRNDYKRAWRKANRDKVKAQKARETARHSVRRAEYHAAYRAAHRRKAAARALAKYHGTLPLRSCITPRCSTVLTGRKKKCRRCKEREAQQAATLLHGKAA